MTSIRKRLDEGFLEEGDIEFFWREKGNVPLCCCEIRFADPKTYERLPEPLYKCDILQVRIPYSQFRKLCLECQAYIEKQLKERKKI